MQLLAIFFILLPALALAQSLTGVASIVDGDTLDIHGERIRLHGIDAPESAQRCFKSDSSPWHCGQKAAFALADHIGRQTVHCEGKERGRYRRLVAVCYLQGKDLNAWMVRQGWALAYRQYSRDYVVQERHAKESKTGIWSGKFVPPWDWRRHRRGGVAANDKDCSDFKTQAAAQRFYEQATRIGWMVTGTAWRVSRCLRKAATLRGIRIKVPPAVETKVPGKVHHHPAGRVPEAGRHAQALTRPSIALPDLPFKSFYLRRHLPIPGCILGDRPPSRGTLTLSVNRCR